jgi:hypothetical protein
MSLTARGYGNTRLIVIALFDRTFAEKFGGIDWDRLTYALDRKFQRRWTPAGRKKNPVQYEDRAEVETILRKYRENL